MRRLGDRSQILRRRDLDLDLRARRGAFAGLSGGGLAGHGRVDGGAWR